MTAKTRANLKINPLTSTQFADGQPVPGEQFIHIADSMAYQTEVDSLSATVAAINSSNGLFTAINNAGGETGTVWTVDSTTGFLAGMTIIYTLNDGTLRTNTIASVDSATQITVSISESGTLADNAIVAAVVPGIASAAMMQIYNVKIYGAKGDGSTNDTAAIQAAIDAAEAAGGGTVFFPLSTYCLSTGLTISSKIRLVGAPGAKLKSIGSNINMVEVLSGSDHVEICDLYFDHNTNTAGNMVRIVSSTFVTVRRCVFTVADTNSTSLAVYVFDGCTNIIVQDCKFETFAFGVYAIQGFKQLLVENCEFSDWGQVAIYIASRSGYSAPNGITIRNNYLHDASDGGDIKYPIQISKSTGPLVKNAIVEGNHIVGSGAKWAASSGDGLADCITLQGVDGFVVDSNKSVNGGEIGMSICRGSRNGRITGNMVTGSYGSAIQVGSLAGYVPDSMQFYDDGTTSYTDIDTATPGTYALTSSVDFFYFGRTSYPFERLLFTVDTANDVAGTLTVKYWNGSAWTALTVLLDTTRDTTDPFKNSTGNISWTAPIDWATTTVNGDTGYFVQISSSANLDPVGFSEIYADYNTQNIIVDGNSAYDYGPASTPTSPVTVYGIYMVAALNCYVAHNNMFNSRDITDVTYYGIFIGSGSLDTSAILNNIIGAFDSTTLVRNAISAPTNWTNTRLHMRRGDANTAGVAAADMLALEDDADVGISFLIPSANDAYLRWLTPTAGETGKLNYDPATGTFTFTASNTSAATLTATALTMASGHINVTPDVANEGLTLNSKDLGAGQSGPRLSIGRNSNAAPAAGYIRLIDKSGTPYSVWVDDSGVLRIHTSPPTNSTDTAGTVVGTQT